MEQRNNLLIWRRRTELNEYNDFCGNGIIFQRKLEMVTFCCLYIIATKRKVCAIWNGGEITVTLVSYIDGDTVYLRVENHSY